MNRENKTVVTIAGKEYNATGFQINAPHFMAGPQWLKTPGRIAVAVVHSKRTENALYFGTGAANGR